MHVNFKERRTLLRYILTLTLCAAAAITALFLYFSQKEYGHIRVSAVDAYTLSPVEGAIILLPDYDLQARTGKDGTVLISGIPVERHFQQNELLAMEAGECTLLAYAEGYLPYALLYTQVYPGSVRQGPTLYLFPEGEDDIDIISVVETPEYSWIRKLLEKYSDFTQ